MPTRSKPTPPACPPPPASARARPTTKGTVRFGAMFSERFDGKGELPERRAEGWATQYLANTRPVTTAMCPGLDGQTFRDTQHRWTSEYDFKSRSGLLKPNNRLWAEYSTFTNNPLFPWSPEAKAFGGTCDGPIVAVIPVYDDGTTSTAVQLAGRTIPGQWNTPWTFTWSKIAETMAHPAWESGTFHFSTDEESFKGVFSGTSGETNTLWGVRSRPIGGPNRWSVYAPRRKLPPVAEDVKVMPFPPTNPERYWPPVELPPVPAPGRIFSSWSACLEDGLPVLDPAALLIYKKWINSVHTCRKACIAAVQKLESGRKSMTMEEVKKVLKITPLPKDVVIENTAIHPKLRGELLMELADGSVQVIPPRTRPILPGAVNRNVDKIRHILQNIHPWLDLSLPEYLELGFPHDSHDTSFAIVLQASGTEFHRHILHWVKALVKEKDKTYLNAFTHPCKDTPPAIGGAIVVKRGMNIKPNGIDWRPTVNHRSPYSELEDAVVKRAKGGPAPAKDALLMPPPAAPTVRNSKGLPYSTNERLATTISKYPPIQYPTPADIGLVACIFLAFRIVIKFSTYDIEGCFHRKAVEPRRAAESLIIEDALAKGLINAAYLSNIVDFGYLDSADISGRCTDSIPKRVDRELNMAITNSQIREMTKEEAEFKAIRGRLFGIDSCHQFLSRSFIYVDDLGNFHPEDHTQLCDTTVLAIGEDMGYVWEIDKNKDGSYIGVEFDVTDIQPNGRVRLRNKKRKAYSAALKQTAERKASTFKILESRVGEGSHAAQVELDIKPLLEPFYESMHVTKTRFDNPDLRPVTPALSQAAREMADILDRSDGLPLFCDIRRPWHYDMATLTQRTDASLPSAEDGFEGYNGFGGWFLSQAPNGILTIHAFYGEWTTEEKEKFASCIAAAEGVTVVFGSILSKAHVLMKTHHKDLLQLTDSLVAEIKYNKMSYGNRMIEKSRLQWEKYARFDKCSTYIDYIPREWNVGGDLLSKGHWLTFKAVCKAAGLPEPILLTLTPEQRDISYLWK